jgi:hypothetical protein
LWRTRFESFKRLSDLLGVFTITVNDAVNDPTRSDGEVIDVCVPFLTEPQTTATARCVDTVYHICKIIRTICGTEGETYWQELAGPGHDGQHPLCPLRILDLVEAGTGVYERAVGRPCDLSENIAEALTIIHGPKDPCINAAVVNYQPALALLFVVRLISADRIGRTPPRRVASDQLAPGHFGLKLLSGPFLGLLTQVVRGRANRRACRDRVVFNEAEGCSRSTLDPEASGLPG